MLQQQTTLIQEITLQAEKEHCIDSNKLKNKNCTIIGCIYIFTLKV